MNPYFILSAAANGAAAGAAVSGSDAAGCMSSGWSLIIVYGALFLLLYLMFFRPQKKKRQAEEELRNSIEVGDEVVTIGGICGRVVSLKEDDIIVIETGADRNKIKMKRWSVSSNETARERQAAAAPAESKKPGLFSGLGKKKEEKSEDK